MATADSTAAKPAKPARTAAATAKPRAKTAAASARSRTAARSQPAKPTASKTSRSRSADSAGYAERAVLIPVGAALIARERFVSSVGDVIATCRTPARAQRQLRKFERRGSTARSQLEHDLRRTRTRVERELRRRRRELERVLGLL